MQFSLAGSRLPVLVMLCSLAACSVTLANNDAPACTNASYDSDGDGWGWEQGQSCRVVNVAPVTTDANGRPVCGAGAVDPDNDGWGWENGASCIVLSRNNTQENVQSRAVELNNPDPVIEIAVVDSTAAFNPNPDLSDITDLFLITGQSNLRASETAYNPVLDTVDGRVFAFTEFGYWSVADLHQPWDDGWFPGNGSWFDDSRQPYNNFSFHFAKSLVELDPSRVVGFIVTSAPGKGIAHWDTGGDYWQFIRNKVQVALDAQGQGRKIDAVLWHQGETDWLFHGTADPEVSGAASTEADYYPRKLNELIASFRNESYAGKGIFICGETLRAALNPHLMALNNDGDNRTACVRGSDLELRPDEAGSPHGVHFSAQALRDLGRRYAERYLQMDSNQ